MRCNNRLFEFGGWFDRTFGKRPADRLLTWRAALSLFVQRRGSVLVESGCQRSVDDWGAGCSTRILGMLLKELGFGRLYSVDNSAEHLAVAKDVVGLDYTSDYVRFFLCDSVQFLSSFQDSIDFLYLDSLDYGPTRPLVSNCQAHQLKELEAAFDKLSSRAVVLLDDNDLPFGGKTRLAKEFLAKHEWLCVLDWQQSLWVRSE